MDMENIRMTVVFGRSKAQEVLPFLSLRKREFSLCYWKLEKAMQGLWGRSVAAQSMALRTEIWRPNNSDRRCQEKKSKKETRMVRKHILFWWAAGKDPDHASVGMLGQRSLLDRFLIGYGHVAKEGRLPKCPASPLLWEERLSSISLAESIVTTQQETPQKMYEFLLLPQVLPFFQGCMLLYAFPVGAVGCRSLAGESTD